MPGIRRLRLGTRVVLVGCVDVLVAEYLAHALVLTQLGIEKKLGRTMVLFGAQVRRRSAC